MLYTAYVVIDGSNPYYVCWYEVILSEINDRSLFGLYYLSFELKHNELFATLGIHVHYVHTEYIYEQMAVHMIILIFIL